jgi:type I restriction enzyme, S subunit
MRTYPEYKDSGVEWIGEIPKGWNSIRLKYCLLAREDKTETGEEELLSVTINEGVIKRTDYIKEGEHTSRSESLIGYRLVSKSNLVNNIMKMGFRCLGISQFNGIVSPAYSVFDLQIDRVNPSFLNYLLRTDLYVSEYKKRSKGIQESRMRLYDDYFLDLFSIVPPLPEQNQVSNYLDRKTQKIDNLIEKTERKIKLLKEQRSSLINQCVTKGLDPNVEMKDSGVEWIGEIPKHWFISKLRYQIDGIKDGTHGSHLNVDDGKLLLSGKNVLDGFLKITDNERTISEEEHNKITSNGFPKKGDVLFVSIGATLGKVCVYELDETISFQRSVCFLRPKKNINSNFLHYLLRSNTSQIQFKNQTNLSTIGGVYMGDIVETYLAVPPVEEQIEVSDSLDIKLLQFEKLLSNETKRIELLKEYRQSLISNVVTGKIDVREEVVQ